MRTFVPIAVGIVLAIALSFVAGEFRERSLEWTADREALERRVELAEELGERLEAELRLRTDSIAVLELELKKNLSRMRSVARSRSALSLRLDSILSSSRDPSTAADALSASLELIDTLQIEVSACRGALEASGGVCELERERSVLLAERVDSLSVLVAASAPLLERAQRMIAPPWHVRLFRDPTAKLAAFGLGLLLGVVVQ